MNKAVSLILCLLFCTPPAAAQQRTPPPPRPRSFFEQNMGITRPGIATEQRREREPTLLEGLIERARARAAAPAPEQEPVPSPSSVTLSVDFNPTFCILNCTPPVNVRPSVPAAPKSSVPAVQFEEGLTPDQLSGRAPLPPSKGLPKPGEYGGGPVIIKGDPNNFPFSLTDWTKFDQGLEEINRIGKAARNSVEEINRLNLQFQTANQPAAPRPTSPTLPEITWGATPSTPSVLNTEDVTAFAASRRPPDIRRVHSGNPAGRATVRTNPGGYIAGSVNDGDEFRVRAYQPRGGRCWMLGDVVGSQYLHNVWIDCRDLPGPDHARRRATDAEVPDNAFESEADLGRRFASIVLPSTDCSGSRDSKYLTDVRRDVEPDKLKLYGNYNPVTKQLTDEINSVVPGNVIKVRYLSDDHLAAEVNYVIIDDSGKRVDNQWGFVSTGILALPLREDKSPCLNPAP